MTAKQKNCFLTKENGYWINLFYFRLLTFERTQFFLAFFPFLFEFLSINPPADFTSKTTKTNKEK